MSKLVTALWYDLIRFYKHVQTCHDIMIQFDTILKTCPDLSQYYDIILHASNMPSTCLQLVQNDTTWLHDEILENLSKLQTKWHKTTKLFLGPLLTSERSKSLQIGINSTDLFVLKPLICQKSHAITPKFPNSSDTNFSKAVRSLSQARGLIGNQDLWAANG